MAKERNKYEQESNDLLQKLPSIECEVIRTAPYFKDGRTKEVHICEVNGELWVPISELGDRTPTVSRIPQLRKSGILTNDDLLPLRAPKTLLWFIRKSAIERCQEKIEEIIGWDLGLDCMHAILSLLNSGQVKTAHPVHFSKKEIANIHRIYEERLAANEKNKEYKRELAESGLSNQDEEENYSTEDFKNAYMEKLFSASDEEMQEAMAAMESVDELAARIVDLCMDWVKHTGNRGGDWGNGLVMGLTKATSYLLTALDKQSTRKDGKKISIIEFYQAMLPVCLEIAKNDIEQKESAEREKRAKEGIN